MNEQTKALFLDLDGTIITTNSGRKFPLHSKDWKLIPETLKAIKHFYKQGYKIIIVTNQGGIEEGYLVSKVFIAKIEGICKTLENTLNMKPNSVSYYFCPSMESYNRKPNPGMAYEAAIDYELDLLNSTMIGDMTSDNYFAASAGIGTYMDVNELLLIDWVNK